MQLSTWLRARANGWDVDDEQHTIRAKTNTDRALLFFVLINTVISVIDCGTFFLNKSKL